MLQRVKRCLNKWRLTYSRVLFWPLSKTHRYKEGHGDILDRVSEKLRQPFHWRIVLRNTCVQRLNLWYVEVQTPLSYFSFVCKNWQPFVSVRFSLTIAPTFLRTWMIFWRPIWLHNPTHLSLKGTTKIPFFQPPTTFLSVSTLIVFWFSVTDKTASRHQV